MKKLVQVYNEVRTKDHWRTMSDYWWDYILGNLKKGDVYYSDDDHKDQWKGTSSSASIGNSDFPIVTAILSLQGL